MLKVFSFKNKIHTCSLMAFLFWYIVDYFFILISFFQMTNLFIHGFAFSFVILLWNKSTVLERNRVTFFFVFCVAACFLIIFTFLFELGFKSWKAFVVFLWVTFLPFITLFIWNVVIYANYTKYSFEITFDIYGRYSIYMRNNSWFS